jgi:lipopolysaccharide biosynthesis protein
MAFFMKINSSNSKEHIKNQEVRKQIEKPIPYMVERPPGMLVTDACKGEVYLAQSGKIIKDKAVLYAHHTNDGKITKSVAKQLENWNNCGWPVVVVDSTAEELPWPDYVTLIRKPNIGSDFGSWSVGLHTMPRLYDIKKLLFANSGVVGPFWSFSNLMRDFEETDKDMWGLTTNSDIDWHIQSYWFGFSNGCLRREPLENFWKSVKIQPTKGHIIVAYEVGMSRLVKKEGWSTRVVYPYQAVGAASGMDTGTYNWDRLLDMGLPFVKRRILNWNSGPMMRKIKEYGNEAIELATEGMSETLSA